MRWKACLRDQTMTGKWGSGALFPGKRLCQPWKEGWSFLPLSFGCLGVLLQVRGPVLLQAPEWGFLPGFFPTLLQHHSFSDSHPSYDSVVNRLGGHVHRPAPSLDRRTSGGWALAAARTPSVLRARAGSSPAETDSSGRNLRAGLPSPSSPLWQPPDWEQRPRGLPFSFCLHPDQSVTEMTHPIMVLREGSPQT